MLPVEDTSFKHSLKRKILDLIKGIANSCIAVYEQIGLRMCKSQLHSTSGMFCHLPIYSKCVRSGLGPGNPHVTHIA